MKKLLIMLMISLTMGMAWGSPTLAKFKAGGERWTYILEPNDLQAVLCVDSSASLNSKYLTVKSYQGDTGPMYVVTLGDTTNLCPTDCSARSGDHWKGHVILGGQENITQVEVEMTDENGFNTSHQIIMVPSECGGSYIFYAAPKE